MDQIPICEDSASLAKLGDEYERQLKMVEIEMSDMPDDCISLVNKYAEIKLKTHLYDLSQSFLDEFYFTKMKDHIEHSYNKSRMEKDIESLEEEIEQEKQANKVLEDFLESTKARLVPEEEMDKQRLMIEKQIENLTTKLDKMFKPPSDFNFDELVAKANLLQSKRKPAK